MRVQMYCIKHIELNADMDKQIISQLLIQISMAIRQGHFDFRTFAFRTKMRECEGESVKMRRRRSESAKMLRRSVICEGEGAIQLLLLRLAHSHFCLCLFCLQEVLVDYIYTVSPKVCRLISEIVGMHALGNRAYYEFLLIF